MRAGDLTEIAISAVNLLSARRNRHLVRFSVVDCIFTRLDLPLTPWSDHFELWRRDRDFHAWKNRMHAEHLMLPAQTRGAPARCFCGEFVTTTSVEQHIHTAHRGIGE